MNEDERIVISKSVSTSLASPIDTYRQNRLTKNVVNGHKITNGAWVSFVSSFLISYPCQSVIRACENRHVPEILSVVLGVCVSNLIKAPLVYNYKRAQTGIKMTARIPIKCLTKVSGISVLEDVLEEGMRYTFTKQNSKNASFSTSCRQSMMLFSMSYPFDLLKNREYHGMASIVGSKRDFLSKLVHKNVQNVLYFQLLNGLVQRSRRTDSVQVGLHTC